MSLRDVIMFVGLTCCRGDWRDEMKKKDEGEDENKNEDEYEDEIKDKEKEEEKEATINIHEDF